MSAAQKSRRDVVEHIYGLVKTRAKHKSCRVKRLSDQSARDSVINGAAWRLILKQRRLGNIRDHVEGSFWHEESTARDKLVSRALDAERKAYIRASEASGGCELLDPATQDDLERYTEAGNVYRDEPSRLIEQEELEAEKVAADDTRDQLAADEFEIMRAAINAYDKTLRPTHRKALWWVVNEPQLTNKAIAARVKLESCYGIKPETVSEIRDHFYSLSAKFRSLIAPDDAVTALLLREVETLKKEVDALKAERRRDSWLRIMSVEEFEAARLSTFWASAAEAFGTTIDGLLGTTIAPKT